MSGYTKLFSSIVDSTIWRETKETKILWITMLALCDQRGIVEASIPGLADRARLSIPETEASLADLMKPDPYSRTEDFEGRRIEKVDGGWTILNHAKYRERMSKEERTEYKREWDRTKRTRQSDTIRQNPTVPTHTEAEADTKKEAGLFNLEIERPKKLTPPQMILVHLPPDYQGSDELKEAVAGFIETCRKRNPLTERAGKMIAKDLASWGLATAIQALETSIRKGWRDVFRPKDSELPGTGKPAVEEWRKHWPTWLRDNNRKPVEYQFAPDHDKSTFWAWLKKQPFYTPSKTKAA